MIYGIGTDLVQVRRMQALWHKYNNKLAKKILGFNERSELAITKQKVHFLAKRFAMKEAIVKVLATGFNFKIIMPEICITHDALGKPEVLFFGNTAEYIKKLGNIKFHISVTDEHDYVLAFAIGEII